MSKPSHPTTEEHRPPAPGDDEPGCPVLLAAFPAPAAFTIPDSGKIVGRASLAEAGIDDNQVSGQHIRFFHAGGRLQVEDVGARNGIYIGGERIPARERVDLDDGDVLRLGRTLLVYREAFKGSLSPEPPLGGAGGLIGPWGLTAVRERLASLEPRTARNVLIEGETGTGKELLAKAVAEAIGRGGKPYVPVNMAAIAASMFEGHLFGWKKGAFSGAVGDSRGVLRAHKGRAVFLDELGELPLDVQPKLLRVIQNREVFPVGEEQPVPIDVALIAATNQPLEIRVMEGKFRHDLLARFLIRLELPPLRDRPEDIFAILQEIRERQGAVRFDLKATEVEAVERLMLEPWDSNVRDVERLAASLARSEPTLRYQAVERALAPRRPKRTLKAAPRAAQPPATIPPPPPEPEATPGGDLRARYQQQQKLLFEDALRLHHWDLAATAKYLETSRSTLGRRMKALGIKKPSKR